MNFKRLLLVFITVFLNACTSSQSNPQMTPIPPPELLKLPADGLVRCAAHPNIDQLGPVVWELPGIPPQDPNSNIRGDRGKDLGVVKNCSTVTLTDYAWSETDKEFYVYIKTENPDDIIETNTTNRLEGWVPSHFLDLSP